MSRRRLKIYGLSISVLLVLAFLPAFSCNNPLISGVGFKVEPNLQTVKVQLNFGQDVVSDLGGSFPVKGYGTIEVEPWTPTTPFNVGFRLNTEVLNDQDFLNLQPVQDLPSGQPLPKAIGRPMARVSLKNPANPNFDVYLFVDVLGNSRGVREWVGVALALKFVNSKYFPAGLEISENFLNGTDGAPRANAGIYGPKIDSNGRMVSPGGIAIFANVHSLVTGSVLEGYDKGKQAYEFEGEFAPYYRQHPRAAYFAGQAFKTLLNANARGGRML